MGKEVPIPEKRIAFTVKLSQNLIQAIRQRAKSTGQSLSDIVTQALEAFLYKGQGRG
ncbi:MAG: CopG family transcriptional regulator [Deltaproteobacteria bacterium]|nr:CopG family transcriptional regulator [Deltaproteobacteria bacterium]